MARVRQQGINLRTAVGLGNRNWSQWHDCSGATIVSSTTPRLAEGDSKYMVDDVVPNYYTRRAKGEVFFNQMRSVVESRRRVEGNGARRKRTTSIDCSGTPRFQEVWNDFNTSERSVLVVSGPVTDPVDVKASSLFTGDEINSFIAEASTKVQSERGRSDSNSWEALAEIHKTMALLPDLFKQFRTIVSKVPAAKKLGSVANAWLAYRYGLMPLIMDIEAVMKGLKKATGKIRKTSRTKLLQRRYSSFVKTASYSSLLETILIQQETVLEVRCMSLDEYEVDVRFNVGLSGKDLITLPWELIPYSFVVDWFANIGDFIGAITPTLGINQLGSCFVVKDTSNLNVTIVGHQAPSGWSMISPGNGSYHTTLITKTRSPTLPSPRILITADFGFGKVKRVLDALSLLVQKVV